MFDCEVTHVYHADLPNLVEEIIWSGPILADLDGQQLVNL